VSDSFDPYRQWLGITAPQRPLDYYQLLGLPAFVEDREQILAAADAAVVRVRGQRPGQHAAQWGQLLDELAAVKGCLTDPSRKTEYDDRLRAEQSTAGAKAASGPQISGESTNVRLFPPGFGAPVGNSTKSTKPASANSASAQANTPETSPAPASDESIPTTHETAPVNPWAMPPTKKAPAVASAATPTEAAPNKVDAWAVPKPKPATPDLQSGSPTPSSAATDSPAAKTTGSVPVLTPVVRSPADPMAPRPIASSVPTAVRSTAPMAIPVSSATPAAMPTGQRDTPGEVDRDAADASGSVGETDDNGPSVMASEGRRRSGLIPLFAGFVAVALVGAIGYGVFKWLGPDGPQAGNTLPVVAKAKTRDEPTKDAAPTAPGTTNGNLPKSPRGDPQVHDSSQSPDPGDPRPKVGDPPTTPLDPTDRDPFVVDPPDPSHPQSVVPGGADPATPEPPMATAAQILAVRTATYEARQAMSRRDMEQARRTLKDAKAYAVTNELLDELDRMNLLLHYVSGFWDAVNQTLRSVQGGEELVIGGQRVAIVDADAKVITLREAGRNNDYSVDNMPVEITEALANRWFDQKLASTKMFVGAFKAVQSPDKLDAARRLWEEAARGGVPDVERLMPVLSEGLKRP